MTRRTWLLAVGLAAAGCRGDRPRATPDAAPRAGPPAPATTALPTVRTEPAATLPAGTPDQDEALARGKAALEAGDLAGALRAFAEAGEGPVTGTSVSAGLLAARLLAEAGETGQARALHEKLVAAAPAVPEVHLAAGRFYIEQSRAPTAILSLRRAIELQPDLLPAYPLLGAVLAQAGRADEAGRVLLQYELRLNGFTRRLVAVEGEPGDRIAVVDLLSTLDDDRAVTALKGALRDPSVHVRLAAAEALAHEADPPVLVALSEAALAERDPVARAALAALLRRAHGRLAAAPEPPEPPPPPRPPDAGARIFAPDAGVP